MVLFFYYQRNEIKSVSLTLNNIYYLREIIGYGAIYLFTCRFFSAGAAAAAFEAAPPGMYEVIRSNSRYYVLL